MSTATDSKSTVSIELPTAQPTVWAGDSFALGITFALAVTVGQRVIGFLRSILFCRLLTDQQLGQWSLVWGFLMLLPPLMVLGLPGCFGKYTEFYAQRGSARTFVLRIGLVSGVATLVGSMVFLLFPEYFAHWLLGDGNATGLIVCVAVTLIGVTISNFAYTLLESIRQVRLVSLMRFVIVAAFTLIGSLTIWVTDRAVEGMTLAYGLSCLISLFPAAWFYWRCRKSIWSHQESTLPHRTMWKRILPFAGWLWLSNLLSNSLELIDRYLLLRLCSGTFEVAQSHVGQYHSSRIIPALLASVATVIAGLMLPYLSKLWEAGKKNEAAHQLNLTFKLLGIAYTAAGIVVLAFAPYFYDTVLQGRYSDGLAIFPATMLTYTWLSLFVVSQEYLWVAERGRWISIALAVGLGLSTCISFFTIPVWNLWGAVISGVCGSLFLVTSTMWLNHRQGCTTDKGIWLVIVLPVLLLVEPILAATVLALICGLALTSDVLFSRDEKQAGVELVANLSNRFKR